MHIFYPNDPRRCQLNREIRAGHEVTRVRQYRYVVCQTDLRRQHLSISGFHEVETITPKEAAQILGVLPVQIYNMGRGGTLTFFEAFGEKALVRSEVESLARDRRADA